jgi:DNA-binding LytR/AlgR family response regulator
MRKRKLEKLLPKEKICRVHKSYMVNLSIIETLERERIRTVRSLSRSAIRTRTRSMPN